MSTQVGATTEIADNVMNILKPASVALILGLAACQTSGSNVPKDAAALAVSFGDAALLDGVRADVVNAEQLIGIRHR